MQHHAGGGNILTANIAEVELDRERRPAVNRFRLVVQRVAPVGNFLRQASVAAEEATVAAVRRGDLMRGNGKRGG